MAELWRRRRWRSPRRRSWATSWSNASSAARAAPARSPRDSRWAPPRWRWADTRPGTRSLADFGPRDGLALGLAQALALLPGVSRNGATLTAARARGFAREDAHALSWRAGLPVIAGAAGLKASRLAQRGAPPGAVPALAAGAGAAFLSTLACAPLIRPGRRGRALWPFALYRAGLALAGPDSASCHDEDCRAPEP